MVTGLVHSTESFGAVDGPGIRYLIFLKGCPMRCRYCHNADTWGAGGGTRMSAAQLLDKAERYKSYWKGGGGITVSGGEALLQIDFLNELMGEAKRRGIHTALDTSGQPFTREEPFFSKFRELMEHTDLVLLDIKEIDDAAHRALTGCPNRSILDCARYLSEIGKSVWIRYVLVPGLTDASDHLRRTRAFLDTLGNVEKVEVLPYHSLGAYKWKELGLTYTLDDVPAPTEAQIAAAQEILGGQA